MRAPFPKPATAIRYSQGQKVSDSEARKGRKRLTSANLKNSVNQLAWENCQECTKMDNSSSLSGIAANRLCLDFVNLPFTSGDPRPHQTSWLELIDFLAEKGVISGARVEELRTLTENDPKAAGTLLSQAERLGNAMRSAFAAMLEAESLKKETAAPIN